MSQNTNPLPDPADIMTIGEGAAQFRVDVKTVARWSQSGRFVEAFRTPGGHRRYSRTYVQAFLTAQGAQR